MAYREVLRFWLEALAPEPWWTVDPALDALIRDRFLPLMRQASRAELHAWRDTAAGRLAEVILLDPFSRNVYRDTPAAFAQDPIALVLAQEAVRAGALEPLPEHQRAGLLLPFMHSEPRAIHALAEAFFATTRRGTTTRSSCSTRRSSTASTATRTATGSSVASPPTRSRPSCSSPGRASERCHSGWRGASAAAPRQDMPG